MVVHHPGAHQRATVFDVHNSGRARRCPFHRHQSYQKIGFGDGLEAKGALLFLSKTQMSADRTEPIREPSDWLCGPMEAGTPINAEVAPSDRWLLNF